MKSKILVLTSYTILLAAMIIVPAAGAEKGNVTPITTPFITIDPVGNHMVGDAFFINGTTNLVALNDSLLLYIGWAGFNPGGFGSSFYTSDVSIRPGERGVNFWSAAIIPSRWEIYTEPPTYYPTPSFENAIPDEYVVYVESLETSVSAEAEQHFFMVSPESRTTPDQTSTPITVQVQPSPFASTVGTRIGISASPIRQVAPLPVIVPVIAIFAGILLSASFNSRKRE